MKIEMKLHEGFEQLYHKFADDKTLVKFLDLDGISPWKLDVGLSSYNFFEKKLADTATDSNSNVNENISPSTYRTALSGGQMKLLGYHTLWYFAMTRYGKKFADEALSAIWKGSLYFHDAHGVKIQMPYCYAFSLAPIVYEGRPYGSMPNTPPKHRKSYISQVDKLISDLSKQFAGATAPSDFFLWYAYYCGGAILDKSYVIQDLQGLVYLFNEPSRAEGESPFTNIGIYDMPGLQNLFGNTVYPNGSKPDLEFIMELQKIFMEWFGKGNPDTKLPYRFPVVTVNLTVDEHKQFLDNDFAQFTAEQNCELGAFNIHFGDKAKLAMCCRYENDLDDMGLTSDSFGNGGINIGSHRVITLNLPRIAREVNLPGVYGLDDNECPYEARMDVMYRKIDHYMEMARKLLIVHRYDILQKRIDKNPDYLQFFGKLGWFNLDTMFSTFGITGINEMCEFSDFDILTDVGTDFVLDVLQHMKSNVKKYRKEDQVVYNIEEIPGEQSCPVLAEKDRILFGEILGYDISDIPPLYSNQYIPLTKPADLITRLELSGRFMGMVSGGGIVHLNIDHKIDSPHKMLELMKYSAQTGVPHMAICYRYGVCENGHTTIIGQANECPLCGGKIMNAMNRVIGYYSWESNWHPTRQKYDATLRKFNEIDYDDGMIF